MLRVTLAGLVINKVLTLEEAEEIDRRLETTVIPTTVKECVEEITAIIKDIRRKNGK